jgi:hypothetical protein
MVQSAQHLADQRCGCSLCQLVAFSNRTATASSSSSPHEGATSCRPIGNPPLERPHGTEMAGKPVRLIGATCRITWRIIRRGRSDRGGKTRRGRRDNQIQRLKHRVTLVPQLLHASPRLNVRRGHCGARRYQWAGSICTSDRNDNRWLTLMDDLLTALSEIGFSRRHSSALPLFRECHSPGEQPTCSRNLHDIAARVGFVHPLKRSYAATCAG